jgi:hypothetical protein
VLNTIAGVGLSGMFTTGIARTWQVGGFGGIPPNAVAVTGNVAVTGQQSAGYLAVTVTPTNNPPSATINFPIGQVRANNVTIPLSPAGKLSAVFKGLAGKKTNLVFDVTGYFLADASGATFAPLTPVRVLNTISGVGLSGKFVAATPRTLTIAGFNGVPGTATAITGNLAVVGPSAGGFASITKDPTATPATSTINFPAGATRANGVFAPLNASGELSIDYGAPPGATVDVVLDVIGYFVPGLTGLKFVPLNPSRIMDTRPTAHLSGLSGKLASGTPRTLDIDGHWGVPVGAAAVTGNLTVVVPGGTGFLSATPDPDPLPATSTLNFTALDTMGNGICGPLNGTGNMSFTYKSTPGKTTDLVLDLSGYFQ